MTVNLDDGIAEIGCEWEFFDDHYSHPGVIVKRHTGYATGWIKYHDGASARTAPVRAAEVDTLLRLMAHVHATDA